MRGTLERKDKRSNLAARVTTAISSLRHLTAQVLEPFVCGLLQGGQPVQQVHQFPDPLLALRRLDPFDLPAKPVGLDSGRFILRIAASDGDGLDINTGYRRPFYRGICAAPVLPQFSNPIW